MLRLLHISDLHFGPPYLPHVGEALLRLAPTLEPEVIVISGDLTQRAKREQFEAARDYMKLLPDVTKVVVPGNHDVPLYRVAERLLDPHRLYREIIDGDLDRVWNVQGACIVSLDSTSPRRAISNGRIHRAQLEFCVRAFRDLPDETAKIVVAHHHFAPAPDYETHQIMPKAKRAMNVFVDLGVDLILGGHLHRAYIGNSLDIYPGNHRDRGIIIVQCGTTTSRRGRAREREKNSFNMIMLGQQVVHVTHYMYFEESDSFEPISRHYFPRPGRHILIPGDGKGGD
jgi:3',5'-cyclic AMP phosphodiesterase CpdA